MPPPPAPASESLPRWRVAHQIGTEAGRPRGVAPALPNYALQQTGWRGGVERAVDRQHQVVSGRYRGLGPFLPPAAER